MNSLRFASSLACMFAVALGCNPTVIESNDDDVADDSTTEGETGESESESSTSESGTETETESESGTETASTETDEATSDTPTTDDTTDTTDDTTETDTGETKHQCGWDLREEYYFCGSDGIDPSMEHPYSCEEIGFTMVPGAPCGEKLGYVGCCDINGDAWYCLNGFLEYEICGGG